MSRKCFHLGILLLLCISLMQPPSSHAETLHFDMVLDKAVQQAYELQLAHLDIAISKTTVLEKKADYYPTLQGRVYSEYLKDLTNTVQPSVVAVGQNILAGGTRFQQSFSLTTSYTVLDFGIRKHQVLQAKKSVREKQAAYQQSLRDLKLKLLDLYAQALLTERKLRAKQAILPLHQVLFAMNQRLFDVGKQSRVTVSDAAIQVAKTINELDLLKQHLATDLQELSFYTHDLYDVDKTELADLEVEDHYKIEPLWDEDLPIYQVYQYRIQEKQAELEVIKRQRFPVLNAYSNYNLYGTDPANLITSLTGVRNRSATFGFSTMIPIFDGFKNKAQRQRAQLELERLQVELKQKLAEEHHTYEKECIALRHAMLNQVHQEEGLSQNGEKLSMLDRLSDKALIERSAYVTQQVAYVEKQQEREENVLKQHTSITRLELLLQKD